MGDANETTTRLGAIRGIEDHGVERYAGIRFAEAPVGELRFAPLVPAGGCEATFDATDFANRAVQPPSADILGPPGPGRPD